MHRIKTTFLALSACMVLLCSFAVADVPVAQISALTAYQPGLALDVTDLSVMSVQSHEEYNTETATTSGNHRMWVTIGNTVNTALSAKSAPLNALKISQSDGLAAGVIRGSANL